MLWLGLLLDPAPVIGGMNAPAGKWPDTAAVLYKQTDGTDQQMCTGVLIAPTVVLTAGHCDPSLDPQIGVLDNVLLGTTSLARPQDGETVPVKTVIQYPSSQSSIDVTVLVLQQPARTTPRAVATGWAKLDIQNGAPVELVGYGAVDQNGNTYIDDLQQAQSTITDYDCTTSSGCNTAARPDGELGAGGMGIDTCPGDSGGPMYLLASYGTYVAGITSRSYDNAQFACGAGGIYGRPDKIVPWIEQMTGVTVTHGPEPTAEAIAAIKGGAGETTIDANDPKSEKHTYAVTAQPAHGMAAVNDKGRVRVCTDKTATGSDSVTVTVTDATDVQRVVPLTIPVTAMDGTAPASCDPTAFSEDGGGCCESGRGGAGSIPLALGVLAVVIRSRRGRNLAQV
ncbi:MAG TPA: trypsin-like serine protease [Kofleriaceae bacterium]|nr:trypsin-like serine protease [Kofleriaceae bacterium]